MKVAGRLSRILIGVAGLALAYMAINEVIDLSRTNFWEEFDPLQSFFGRSVIISIPAIPIGLVLAALRPKLWPLPLVALIWTITATVFVDPRAFDFIIEWLLQFSSQN